VQVQQEQQGPKGRRWVTVVVGVVATVALLAVVRGLVVGGDASGGGGGGGGESCADPTFVVDVKTFTDKPIDPINVPQMHTVSLEGTVTMTGRHPANVGSIVVPMASSPGALVYADLDADDRILEPGVAAPFSGSGSVELTGSPVVIPDDTAAEVAWQYEDAAHYVDC
jgi:hypothetical protein